MANNVVNRQVNIFIESGLAQKALDALIKKEKELKDALAKATDPKQISKLKEELDKLQEPLDRAKRKVSGELAPSFRDVQATVNSLGNRMRRMSEQDADFSTVLTQYRQANKELEEQRGKIGLLSRAMKSFWQEAKTVAVGVVIGNTIQSALQTVLGYVTGIVSGSAKISDELADIQRITGLTKDEVRALNGELKKIDTRTSTTALRDIAVVAGKLGIEGKQDIVGFVTAVDKLNIALGGELGDINAFTTDLGKILNVFEGKITGENITSVGNAIVDLANKGVASGPFIVDFTQRLAGIAKTSNLSLGSVIGLAAGLEESGLKVESSSTAISKLLVTIGEDVPKAAKVAGKDVKEFTELFAKAPQEALLQFAQGLQKDKGSFAEIATSFKDAGEEGARVISTLATLGQKTDFFRDKMNDAGTALKNTTQIENAFELKNKNAGAELDKFRKNIASVFQSSTFQQAGEGAIRLMNSFIGILRGSVGFIKEHGGLIASLGAIYILATKSIEGATIANIKNAVVTRAKIVLAALERTVTAASVAAQLIYANVVDLVTKRVTLAAAAQRIWNVVLSLGAGPLGIILVAAGALVIGIEKLFNRTKELTAEQKVQAEVAKRVNDATIDQVTKINVLVKTIESENTSLSNKKKAYDQLIAINPEFAKTLSLDAQGHLQGKEAIDKYIISLKQKAEAEAKYSLLVDKLKEQTDQFNKIRSKVPELAGLNDADLKKNIDKAFKNVSGKAPLQALTIAGVKVGDLKDTDEQIKILNDQVQKSAEKNIENITGTTANVVDAADKSVAAAKKRIQQAIDDLKAAYGKLAETDKKAREANLAQQKTLEDQLDALDGKTKSGGSSGGGDSKKSALAKIAIDLKDLSETSILARGSIQQLQERLEALQKKGNKVSKSDIEKLSDDLKKLKEGISEINKIDDELQLVNLSEFQKELLKLDQKYESIRAKLKGQNALLLELEIRYQKERANIIDKFAKEAAEKAAKLDEEQKKRILEIALHANDELAKALSENNPHQEELKKQFGAFQEGNKTFNQKDKEQEKEEIDALKDLHDAKLISEEEFEKGVDEIHARHEATRMQHSLEQFIKYASGALDLFNTFNQIKTDKENAELDSDRRRNDVKKANLERRLKGGLTTQLQYNREIDKIEREQQAKEKQARIKQFNRNKIANAAQAAIDGAGALIKTIEIFGPPVPPNFLGIVASAVTIGTTLAKIVAITSQKPPEFAHGGKLGGQLHSGGGNPIIDSRTGKKIGNIERGEGIVNRRTMADDKKYTVTGTPSQIASVLNSIKGGVHWESGATIESHKKEKIIHILEKGATKEERFIKLLGAPVMPNAVSIITNNIITHNTLSKAAAIAGQTKKEFTNAVVPLQARAETNKTLRQAQERPIVESKTIHNRESHITNVLQSLKGGANWLPGTKIENNKQEKIIRILEKGVEREIRFTKLLGSPVAPNVASIIANKIITHKTISKAAAIAGQTKKEFTKALIPAKAETRGSTFYVIPDLIRNLFKESASKALRQAQETPVIESKTIHSRESRIANILQSLKGGAHWLPGTKIESNKQERIIRILEKGAEREVKIIKLIGAPVLPNVASIIANKIITHKTISKAAAIAGQTKREFTTAVIPPQAKAERIFESKTIYNTESPITNILQSLKGGAHWLPGTKIESNKQERIIRILEKGAEREVKIIKLIGAPVLPNVASIIANKIITHKTISKAAAIAGQTKKEFTKAALRQAQDRPIVERKTIHNRESRITSILQSIKEGVHWLPGAKIENKKQEKIIRILEKGAEREVKIIKLLGAPVFPNVVSMVANNFVTNNSISKAAAAAGFSKKEFAVGGKLSGPSHSDKSKGMPVIHPYTGITQAYLEGNEGIVNKKTMAENRQYIVSGTPNQIISKLNGLYGIEWTTGAVLRPAWSTHRPAQMNVPAIKKYYATGGQFQAAAAANSNSQSQENIQSSNALLSRLNDTMMMMQGTISDLQKTVATVQKKGIRSKVVLSDVEDQQERIDAIRDDATLKG